jgi:DNA primase
VATTTQEPTTDTTTLRQLTAAAAAIFTEPPRRKAALTYLRQRGIDTTALPDQWPLGYAPPGWTRLVERLHGAFNDQALLDAGLAQRSSRGTLIDTFHDRVIFPIHNQDGWVAGFIGRDLSGSDHAPKYLNSRQSPIFDKGALLYGLHESETTNPDAQQPVIVEGPLDVIAITTRSRTTGDTDLLPVAACGTAFTFTHARRVAEVAFEDHAPAVVAFDADAAGRAAALTAGEHLRYVGLDVHLSVLPRGTDPADHLTQPASTLDLFRADEALPLLTVQLQRAVDTQGDRMQWIEGRLAVARTIAAYLATYPTSYTAAQVGWIANALDLDASTFTNEVVEAYRQAGTTRSAPRGSLFDNAIANEASGSRHRQWERVVGRYRGPSSGKVVGQIDR